MPLSHVSCLSVSEVGMRIGSYQVKADWGHMALAVSITLFCIWYLFDARTASPNIQNMLLIFPATILAIALFLVIVAQEVKVSRVQGVEARSGASLSFHWPDLDRMRLPLFMGLLGVYVFTMEGVGFDLATFLFLALSLALQGERRWIWLIGFSLVFALFVTWVFKAMIPEPIPTRFW